MRQFDRFEKEIRPELRRFFKKSFMSLFFNKNSEPPRERVRAFAFKGLADEVGGTGSEIVRKHHQINLLPFPRWFFRAYSKGRFVHGCVGRAT